jgi:hypothetical protein
MPSGYRRHREHGRRGEFLRLRLKPRLNGSRVRSEVCRIMSRIKLRKTIGRFLNRLGRVRETLAVAHLGFTLIKSMRSDVNESHDMGLVVRLNAERTPIHWRSRPIPPRPRRPLA